MALNNSSLTRTATRFRQVLIWAGKFGSDPTDLGQRANRVPATVRGAPGQTANIAEFQKSDATVLSAIDANGFVQAPNLQQVSVTITSAQLLALFTTAIQLVAAPGAGQALEFISGTITYTHVATDYTVGASTNLSVKYKDKTGADVSTTRATTGFIDGATVSSMFRPLTAQLALDTNAINQPLVLALLVANPTGGDGTLHVNVIFRVHVM